MRNILHAAARHLDQVQRAAIGPGGSREDSRVDGKADTLAEHPQSPSDFRWRGSIVFDHVNFEYRPGEPILKDLSFTVAAGQKIAIVGADRLGQDHHHQAAESLVRRDQRTNPGRRRRCARVGPRRAAARDRLRAAGRVSVRRRRDCENIRLSRTELSEAEVRDALRRAQALRFVERLPGASRRKFASAARTCRRASGNCCRSRARSRTTRESS